MDLIEKMLKEQGKMLQHYLKLCHLKNPGYRLKFNEALGLKTRKPYFPSGDHLKHQYTLGQISSDFSSAGSHSP